jgi:hypothetical protein
VPATRGHEKAGQSASCASVHYSTPRDVLKNFGVLSQGTYWPYHTETVHKRDSTLASE